MRVRTRVLQENVVPGEERFKEPRIFDMPSYTMAVVESGGDPSDVRQDVLKALYDAVYGLKFQLRRSGGDDFKVQSLRFRRSEDSSGVISWGLPIPDGVTSVPTRPGGPRVRIGVWEHGAVAQILHVGPLSEEGETAAYLQRFIEDSGYEIAGPREEEYLTAPNASEPKVYIRYQVRRRRA